MRTAAMLRRIAASLPVLLAFLLPFSLSMRGTDWAVLMHPDEPIIHHAMLHFAHNPNPAVSKTSVYPEGFFVVAETCRRAAAPFAWIGRQMGQEACLHRNLDAIRAPTIRRDLPTIRTGRRANAIMAGLCGLFLFLAVRAATGSVAGGLCAMLLSGCSPFVVEFAHYCETDLPFCAGMALSLMAYFNALRRRSLHWATASAAASAAAFACKYTVAPLVPFCVLVFLAICYSAIKSAATQDERRHAIRRCARAAIASLIAAIAAYAVFTPLFRTDLWQWATTILNIYGEAHGEAAGKDLPFMADVPFARVRYILHLILVHCRTMGPVRLAIAAASSAWLVLRRRRNPCGAWLTGLVALFLAFDLACMPWVRSQEFLPFAIMLGTLPALAVGELSAAACGMSRHRLARHVVPALCMAACCAIALGDALRASAAFATEDSRDIMRQWLEQSANPATPIAANRFAHHALRHGRIATAKRFDEPEILWQPGADAPDCHYFARQSHLIGRGFVDFATGDRIPFLAAGWTNFLSHATLLRKWQLTPGYQTTFAQLPMELWGIIPENARLVVPGTPAPRPTAYRMGQEHYYAAQGGDWLGPIDAIRTVGARKEVRFVPPRDGRPLYAVTRHADGLIPAKIKWEGCFEPRERIVAPGRADWFLYKPSPLGGWGDIYVRTRMRMRGDDQTSLCLTTITADPAFAAELLARGGSPDKAAELLASAGLPQDAGAAIAQAVKPLPDKFYRDFARIRFGDFSVTPGPDTFTEEMAEATSPITAELESEFPVLFDPGTYRVSFRIPLKGRDSPEVKSISFTKATSQRIIAGDSFQPDEHVEMELAFDKPACPHIRGVTVCDPGKTPAVTLEDFTITWKPELRDAGR